MWRLGHLSWELRAGLTYWCRNALRRVGRRRWIVDARPAICISNLLMVGVVHAVADHLPRDVTLNEGNILDYTQEFPDDRNLARIWGNAAAVWRFFRKGAKRFGDSTELLVGGLADGKAIRVQVGFVHQPDFVRVHIAQSEKPVSAEDMRLPGSLDTN